MGFTTNATNAPMRVAKWNSGTMAIDYTSTFGGSARTLGNLVGVGANGIFQNGGEEIIQLFLTTNTHAFWSFTQDFRTPQAYDTSNNCMGATSNLNSNSGKIAVQASGSDFYIDSDITIACDGASIYTQLLFCIAR